MLQTWSLVSGKRGLGWVSFLMVKEGQMVKSRLVIVRVVRSPADDVGLFMVVSFQHLVLVFYGPV